MSWKDRINKISGIASIGTLIPIILGQLVGNDSWLGFPNAMLLYVLMPSALIWFGTRKNGCGSCNQTCSTPETEHERKSKTTFNLTTVFPNQNIIT